MFDKIAKGPDGMLISGSYAIAHSNRNKDMQSEPVVYSGGFGG